MAAEKPQLPTKPKKRNKKRNPSEIVVASIVKMPLGELSRLASMLYEKDVDSAEFLTKKLSDEYSERIRCEPPRPRSDEEAGGG